METARTTWSRNSQGLPANVRLSFRASPPSSQPLHLLPSVAKKTFGLRWRRGGGGGGPSLTRPRGIARRRSARGDDREGCRADHPVRPSTCVKIVFDSKTLGDVFEDAWKPLRV